MLSEMPNLLESQGFEPGYLSDDVEKRKPKLHLKSQFFASEQTISTVIPLEEWEPVIRKYILARARQTVHRESHVDAKDLRAALEKDVAALIASWREGLSKEARDEALVYMTVGSHNQDYRSMIMDGESLFVIGHAWAMIAYLDFVSLIGQTTWVDNMRQLEELLPQYKEFWKWLGRYLKIAL